MIVAFTGHRSPYWWVDIPDDAICCMSPERLHYSQELEALSSALPGWRWATPTRSLWCALNWASPTSLLGRRSIGQEKRWVAKSKRVYQALLNKAVETVVVCPEFSIAAYQKRNEWMVDNCDQLIACWNETAGNGELRCLRQEGRKTHPLPPTPRSCPLTNALALLTLPLPRRTPNQGEPQ